MALAKKTAEEKAAEETTAEEKTAEEKTADQKPGVTLPKGWLLVTTKHYTQDPFEGTKFPESEKTPTKNTNWVTAQVAAGLLTVIKEG